MSDKRTETITGHSHQILISEICLPGIEVSAENLLHKILGKLGKENPSKDDVKLPLYSAQSV